MPESRPQAQINQFMLMLVFARTIRGKFLDTIDGTITYLHSLTSDTAETPYELRSFLGFVGDNF